MHFYPEEAAALPDLFTLSQLEQAAKSGAVLQSTAISFDTEKNLTLQLAGLPVKMPYEDCAMGIREGLVREIAVLTRVGRAVSFVVTDVTRTENGPVIRISRTKAQARCKNEYLDRLQYGDIIPCTVTHIEPFGAFCDVGCGVCALLPIDCMSVSRIASPSDRVRCGQKLFCAVKGRDDKGRLVLTLKELLGTWEENAALFCAGMTVTGQVRSVESYGVFIELTPNLAGLAEPDERLSQGDTVSVYIKSILPDKMKVKLVVVARLEPAPFVPLRPFITGGHIDRWVYSPPGSRRLVETVFANSADKSNKSP